MTRARKHGWRYSLSTLLGLMLLLNLVLAYLSTVGSWRFVMAIGPPILIGGAIRGILGEHDRPDVPRQEGVQVLGCLVAGFAIWLPVLAIICFRS